jgi:hypothetical protein
MHARKGRAIERNGADPTRRTRRHVERNSGPRNAKYGHLCQRATRLDVLPWRASLGDTPAAGVHGSFLAGRVPEGPGERLPYWFKSY